VEQRQEHLFSFIKHKQSHRGEAMNK